MIAVGLIVPKGENTNHSNQQRMQRIFLFLLLSFSLTASVQAQVTQISSNKSLQLITHLGNGKALLEEAGMHRLWVTDGSAAGTFQLADTLVFNNAGGLLNGQYIFAATSPAFGSELWITDGTVAGTRLVKDIYPGKTGAEPQDDFVLLNGSLYFSATTASEGRELWRTDGTDAGTSLLADLVTGPGGSALKGRYDLFSNGTFLLFNSVANSSAGYELWRSDGTAAGTYLLKDINPNGASSNPSSYQVYNGMVLFWAETAAEGRELWRTDGTTGGTQLVKDIRSGTASSINAGFPMPTISVLYPFNNRLLFMADDGTSGEEIWTTDGTEGGTYRLQDINPGADRSFVTLPASVPLNGKLYFAAYKPESGSELWETDGTTAGTKLFKEILPGLDGGIPFLMPNFKFSSASGWPVHQGSFFYFMFGLPADGGVELWKSDGTDAGTVKVKVIKTSDSDFGNLSYVYTTAGLYFSVDDGAHSDELWKSDGTQAGTSLVIDLNPNSGEGSDISFFPIPVNNKYVFTATNGDNAFMWDLYHLDGDLVPLPVKLQNFTAVLTGADAQLRWLTASEENTLEFVVERSEDGARFSRIGAIAAAGTATQQSYSFRDAGVATSHRSIVYYRLRTKDRDGKETLSKVVPLHLKGDAGFAVQLLGNPVQQEIRVLVSKTNAPVNLSLKDGAGRTVKTWQAKSEGSMLSLPIGNVAIAFHFCLRAKHLS
ncbi:MAG: hypothetical protein EON98_01415 [Chitinophagaceae bacterium]|nr:MAG: hypothetical protein EON98_01415 [Chitinophagaceae bacterium]